MIVELRLKMRFSTYMDRPFLQQAGRSARRFDECGSTSAVPAKYASIVHGVQGTCPIAAPALTWQKTDTDRPGRQL
jgi:hypothetical protein